MSVHGFGLLSLSSNPFSVFNVQPLGGDGSAEQMIDAWVSMELQNPKNSKADIKGTQRMLTSFLKNPQRESLCLDDVYLEPLLPILIHPSFSSRLKNLIFQECSMSEECNALDPFFQNISQFPHLKNLTFHQCEIQEFPQALWNHDHLVAVELIECTLSSSFDPMKAILHSQHLSSLQINSTKLCLDQIRSKLNRAAPIISELYKNEFFKRTLFDYLAFANQDAVFRESFFAILDPERVVWNETQCVFSIALIDRAARLQQAYLQGIVAYAEYLIGTIRPQELLRNYVALQMGQDSPFDSTEMYMAYLGKLKSVFNWTLEYFPATERSSSLPILEVDQERAREYLRGQLDSKSSICLYLIEQPNWSNLLFSQFPREIEAASKEGALDLSRCQLRLTEMVLDQIYQHKEASLYRPGEKRGVNAPSLGCESTSKRARPDMR